MSTDRIFVKGAGGLVITMDLPLHEAIADQLTRGHIRRVNEDGSPYVEPAAEPPARPATSAAKAEWVGYAVRVGGMTPDDAEAMTKADLIERFGKEN